MTSNVFWKAVTTVKVGPYDRGEGFTRYFESLDIVKRFIGQVELDEQLDKVKAFRFVPMAFNDPSEGIREKVSESSDDIW